ncbi:uncharacterized protein LOC118645385 [Monomorium pharaonis]|uniref:uncharacterized protein LOC118645385 n=1 Tax=Monomorium pharaonis TaxID=307658 RepID=UPI0017476D81|nr:uncharacterized protein LOC118645385 [Monomorium pharaonis]
MYGLQTVTYGTRPGNYLAVRCLHQLAMDKEENFPLASEVLKRDFYVDDLLTGADNYERALQIRNELIQLLRRGGFHLRQWASNTSSLIDDLGERSDIEHLCLGGEDSVKTLGIQWRCKDDTIIYIMNTRINGNERLTKRTLLSQIAAIFDPLGLLGPIIVKAKIVMQLLWQLKLEWDETVPMDIFTLWNEYKTQLNSINGFSFPKRIMLGDSDLQLHGFCDASKKAFGACIYLRSTSQTGDRMVRLVCAKSRVAPLKKVSLPRLELCAAVLLANLYKVTSGSLKRDFRSIHFWSDSTIAIHWIHSSPHRLKTFVANRVAQIQTTTEKSYWRYVPSQQNPADPLSRGQMPEAFAQNQLWKNGPDWLMADEDEWPANLVEEIVVPEQRSTVNLQTAISADFVERFSSVFLLTRVIAYCLRFVHNCRKKEKRTGSITTEELREATNCVILAVQANAFANELYNLRHGRPLHSKSRILALNPFIDNVGILRVGGRLQNADMRYARKHPILLPNNNFTKLIFKYVHISNYHCGVQATLYAVRQNYWAVRGKDIAKYTVRTCMRCFRFAAPAPKYQMGNLPMDRVVNDRPFEKRFCVDRGVKWNFIPPRSPHFGGLWEAAVKGFKHHMRRTLGETLFTFEEFNTFVIEIEGVLNSRPLTALSSDPNDCLALTPAHFLIGTSLSDIPEVDLTDVPTNRLSIWKHIQKIKQNFWRRWSKEYLNELQQRTKWLNSHASCIKPGILVLIKDDNTAPLQWSMGRIVVVHPGDNNIVRVVTVNTQNGTYKRNVRALAPLPIE